MNLRNIQSLFFAIMGFASLLPSQVCGSDVFLRVTDQNENAIPWCKIFWRTNNELSWREPAVIYRIGPTGVNGDGSVLSEIREVSPEIGNRDRRLGQASVNYIIIPNPRTTGTLFVKVTAEGYRPAELQFGEIDPNKRLVFYQAATLRRDRASPPPAPMNSPSAAETNPSGETYGVQLYFVRPSNARAPNVTFKLIMNDSGYTVVGKSDANGEARVTVPQYGQCRIVVYNSNGSERIINEVVAMNVIKDITILW